MLGERPVLRSQVFAARFGLLTNVNPAHQYSTNSAGVRVQLTSLNERTSGGGTMSEAWKQWQGQIVDAKFPLRQYLGGSEHSAVFLTERGEPSQKAAIKFIQVEETETELQLSHWKRALQLSHPHVLRVFDCGRCRLGDFDLIYVVMEFAGENLAQFLPQRPLTPAEARDVLAPALVALAYLHSQGLVHGHVQPSNILAIEDVLKLSSDGISLVSEIPPEGAPTAILSTPYAAPEAAAGNISPSADIWSLGMTLVETLTQRLPVVDTNASPSIQPQDPQLPDTLPALFLDIARHCLKRDPQQRWTVVEIGARLNPSAPVAVAPVAKPAAAATSASVVNAGQPAHTLAQAQEQSTMAVPRSEPIYQPATPARPPLHVQSGAIRDPLSRPRYDLSLPRLKRPPLMPMPKSNYLVLGILVALGLAALLVVPRMLSHRGATGQAASIEPKEPPAAKPPQLLTHEKNQAKSQQKVSSTAAAPIAQRPSTPPQAARDKQTASALSASPNKAIPAPATASLRSEPAPPPAASNVAAKSSPGAAPGEVLSQVLPEPSQKAQATIRGKVRVGVKVHVDTAGNVTGAEFASPGPSKYFADLALQAARRWDFAPAKIDGHAVASDWLIVFHFTPAGSKAFPSQATP